MGGIGRKGDTIPWHIPGLQEDAAVIEKLVQFNLF